MDLRTDRFETVAVLWRVRFPGVIKDDDVLIEDSFVLPDDVLGDVSATLKVPST